MSEPLVFQQFENITEAEKVAAILEDAGIKTLVEKPSSILDSNIIGAKYGPTVNLKISGSDFKEAREILVEKMKVDLDDVDEDYMLLSFTNEELMDVVAKADEWGFYNYNIAIELLKKRGVSVSQEQKDTFAEERLTDLSQTKAIGVSWILFGYFIPVLNLCYFIFGYQATLAATGGWMFPGFGGLILGYVMSKAKTTLPDGQRLFVYDKNTRMHGFLILRINLLFWLVNIILFIINLVSFL